MGGYSVDDGAYYVAENHTFPSGNKAVHGQRGEVVGSATGEKTKGKGLAMRFPGNKGVVNCYLTSLSREPPVRSARGMRAVLVCRAAGSL